MKRTLVLTLLALLGFTAAHAQQQFATLQHGDSISAYYGHNALVAAHEVAVNGDIITLSSGIFYSPAITKAVMIRGAGAWADSLGNQTIIRNVSLIGGSQDTLHHLTFEGIYFLNVVQVSSDGLYNPQFIKCYFADNFYCRYQNDGWMQNATFVNCYLAEWFASYNGGTKGASNTHFVNSVIADFYNYSCPDVFINCVLPQHSGADAMLNRVFRNCVLYSDETTCPSSNSATAFNSIFIQTRANDGCENLFSGHPNHTLWNIRGWNTVFKTSGFYELNDSIASTFLGSDGTQVGIYGGQFPFNPRVLNYSATVASQSRPDGKLEVTIQPIND